MWSETREASDLGSDLEVTQVTQASTIKDSISARRYGPSGRPQTGCPYVRASRTAVVLGLASNNHGTCMLREAHRALDENSSISEFYKVVSSISKDLRSFSTPNGHLQQEEHPEMSER